MFPVNFFILCSNKSVQLSIIGCLMVCYGPILLVCIGTIWYPCRPQITYGVGKTLTGIHYYKYQTKDAS